MKAVPGERVHLLWLFHPLIRPGWRIPDAPIFCIVLTGKRVLERRAFANVYLQGTISREVIMFTLSRLALALWPAAFQRKVLLVGDYEFTQDRPIP